MRQSILKLAQFGNPAINCLVCCSSRQHRAVWILPQWACISTCCSVHYNSMALIRAVSMPQLLSKLTERQISHSKGFQGISGGYNTLKICQIL